MATFSTAQGEEAAQQQFMRIAYDQGKFEDVDEWHTDVFTFIQGEVQAQAERQMAM